MKGDYLKHKDHKLNWTQENTLTGKFLRAYCTKCFIDIGTLNISIILEEME